MKTTFLDRKHKEMGWYPANMVGRKDDATLLADGLGIHEQM